MRIEKKRLCSCFFITILILYGLSRGSWGNIIPYTVWQVLVILAIGYFGVCSLNYFRRCTNYTILCIILIAIVALFNNYNFKNSDMYYESVFLALLLLSISMTNRGEWISWAYKLMLVLGIFYAVMTLASFMNEGFYDSFIYPFLSKYSSTKYLALSEYYTVGFTSHYSTNGMYVALGTCMGCGGLINSNGVSKNGKALRILFLLMMLVALLLTNKRAHILFTCAGMLVCYYLYNADHPISRFGKILGIMFGALIITYIIYSIAPATLGFLDRFVEEESKGDVSSNRFLLWGFAVDMFKNNNILFGSGWFSFYYEYTYHAHNIYLQLLAETGIVGALFFYIFMIVNYYRAAKLLVQSRKGKIEIGKIAERRLVVSLVYQTFFLLYGITGTCLYELQSLVPYIILCTVGEYYWHQMNLSERG